MCRVTIQIACESPFLAPIGDIVLDGKLNPSGVDLPSGAHDLIWAVVGGAGGAFEATVREGGRTLCSVSDWKIPAGGGWSGGMASFQV